MNKGESMRPLPMGSSKCICCKDKVEALYVAPTWFEIDFDLRNVTSWYIKYDVLNVIHNKGEDWKSYQSSGAGDCDYSSPERQYITELGEDGDELDWEVV